jgi:two-component system sensor histidine kinase KdpD
VYPPERVSAALNNFFKIENLAALREIALRQVAEEVESKRIVRELVGTRENRVIDDAPQAVGERILVLAGPRRQSQRVVRRAWRSAQRLGAPLDVLTVLRPGRPPSEEEEHQLTALRRLVSLLGAHLIVEEDDDIAAATARVAKERASTYVLMGTPKPRNAWRRLTSPALPFRLLRELPGIDLRIVADRTRREEDAK